MEEDKEKFLARWSRLKRTASDAPVPRPAGAAAPPVELPPVDSLDISSDFSAFLQPEVEESLKRAALAKLFHSGQFNQMDGLDVYIDDYSVSEPIPEDMLRALLRAQGTPGTGDEERAAQESAVAERRDQPETEPVAEADPGSPPAEGQSPPQS